MPLNAQNVPLSHHKVLSNLHEQAQPCFALAQRRDGPNSKRKSVDIWHQCQTAFTNKPGWLPQPLLLLFGQCHCFTAICIDFCII